MLVFGDLLEVVFWVSHERLSRLSANYHHGSGDFDPGPTLPLSASRKVIQCAVYFGGELGRRATESKSRR
jgi:hypothetical protein